MKKKTKKTQAKKSAPRAANPAGNKAGFRPIADRVLVKPQVQEDGQTTSFGIIIPDTAKEKPKQGTVVAVGTGRHD